MFIGHFAVAFAAKKAAPRASMGLLILAAEFLDVLWPVLLLAGVESATLVPSKNPFLNIVFDRYPISHSLLTTLVWSVLLGLLYAWRGRDRSGAVVVGAVVASHWVLDVVAHRPDLPLLPGGGPKLGLGLWSAPEATVAIELVMYALGVALYVHTTRARDRIGSIGFWSYVVVILGLYGASLAGPPPPSMRVVAYTGLTFSVFALWAWWFDRHREVRAAPR